MSCVDGEESVEASSEWEVVEDSLIQVELSGVFKNDVYSENGKLLNVKFVELDSDSPVVQIGNKVFVGSYKPTVGTSLFFTQTKDTTASDSASLLFDKENSCKVEYFGKTNKRLVLTRVFLTSKEEDVDKEPPKNSVEK